jgi:hypothetical protein
MFRAIMRPSFDPIVGGSIVVRDSAVSAQKLVNPVLKEWSALWLSVCCRRDVPYGVPSRLPKTNRSAV